MRKLISGITDFRRRLLPCDKESFAKLALGQTPDALFIACSDSRVVPNLFASTNPGDLFVVRNVGNMIPPCRENGCSVGDKSEAAAIEFSLLNLNVSSIVICGHSECGAMKSLIEKHDHAQSPNLRSWLQYGERSLKKYQEQDISFLNKKSLLPHNQLSQINVLEQKINLESYPAVQVRLQEGRLRIYCWWFDIAAASVYSFHESKKQFVLLDEEEAERLLSLMK
jgi:carbonic anhydrase